MPKSSASSNTSRKTPDLGKVKEPTGGQPTRRFQFGIWTLLVVTTLVAICAALMSGLIRWKDVDEAWYRGFLFAMMAAPLGVMILISLLRLLPRRRLPPSDDDFRSP